MKKNQCVEKDTILIWKSITLTILLAILVGTLLLNSIWENFSPSFPIERVFPAITAPVDGPFYLENANNGFQWKSKDPLSLWFHPLLSVVVRFMPNWLPSNYWFWIISIFFGIGSLLSTWRIAQILSTSNLSPSIIPSILLIPGGLSLATGNPEIPNLFFNSLLFLAVIRKKQWWVVVTFALMAILTKPNSLYMVAILLIYAFSGYTKNDNELKNLSLLGMFAILLGWSLWIGYVDYKTGELGSYWNSRLLFNNYVAGNPINFFIQLVNSFTYTHDIRDQIRYSTALLIPIINFWLIGSVKLSDETHRYALASGNLSMFLISLLQGNPNKLIVYSTTLPGYFSVFIIIFHSILVQDRLENSRYRPIGPSLLILYCLFSLTLYILGTPLGWYY